MRVLFLTNYYQTDGSGGEEQSCQQVVEGLEQRGHTTLVLTSMHGTNNVPVEGGRIYRSLYLEVDLVPWRHSVTFFTRRKAREQHNLQRFERLVRQFEPDVIFIWGMYNLPRSLPLLAETMYPDRVSYRFATYWPTLPSAHEFYWRAPGRKWFSRITKRILGQFALAMLANEVRQYPLTFKHSICVSAATRKILVEAGIPISNARIIHTGLDVTTYLDLEQLQRDRNEPALNLLYAGRLAAGKGIETAIEAMKKLVFDLDRQEIRLSLAGSGSADYENYLLSLVDQAGLTDHVSFLEWVPPAEIPELFRKFDVLVVPSTWPEPFARVVLEGMVSGLVVVATPTGGTPEIVLDSENGLLFAAGDAEDLAQKIVCLLADSRLRQRLALAGQQTVVERFTKKKMMDEIESYLQEVIQSSTR
jgi:glycosyltransferase involved in cell wall biosynthesis